MSHIYCPECGFQNPEAANYCSKCGALLVKDEGADSTVTLSPDELADEGGPAALEDVRGEGPALVVRSGGGRTGETFLPSGERPIVVSSASALNVSPALPPPDRTTSAGPLIPRSSSAASGDPSPSSGVNDCVISVPASSLTRRAPQREQ